MCDQDEDRDELRRLRCPSEIVELRWSDINPVRHHERSLMTVRSPKTAAHDGHAVRIVPITPELRPILQALFDQAPEIGRASCRERV